MANRYWVGGTGSWSSSNITNWSTSSGGGGNASVPISTDNVIFDGNSGGGTVTVTTSTGATDFTFTGFTGTFKATTSTPSIRGNLTLGSSMTCSAGLNMVGTGSITSNGVTINGRLTINTSGTITLADNLTIGNGEYLYFSQGTFTANNKNMNVPVVYNNAGANAVTFNLGTGILTVTTGYFNWNTNSNSVINSSTSTIKLNGGDSFNGGGKTYYNVEIIGTGTFTFNDNNTFNAITVSSTSPTLKFTDGTTTTFSNFGLSGSAGNLVTITNTSTSAFTFSQSSGSPTARYVNLSKCTATGGANWFASNSTNGGSNTGWTFVTGSSGGLLEFF